MSKYTILLLLVAYIFYIATAAENGKTYVKIISKKSKLAFDGTERNLVAKNEDNSDAQLWELRPTGTGSYYIVNKKTGHVMDIQNGCGKSANAITYEFHGKMNQQFFINSDSTIGTSCGPNIIIVIDKDKNVGTGTRGKSSDYMYKIVKA